MKEYLKPYMRQMSLGITIKAVGSFIELLLPYTLALIIDDIIPTRNIEKVSLYGFGMVVLAFIAYRMNVIANRRASKISKEIIVEMRDDLFQRALNLTSHQIDQITISSLETRVTTDTYNVHRMLGMTQRMGIRGPILLLGGIIISFAMEPVLALVMVSMLPFITILTYFRAKKSIPLYRQVQERQDHLIGVVRENIQGMRIIKAFVQHEHEEMKFESVNDGLASTETYVGTKMALINPLMNLFMNVGMVLVILVGAYRVSSGYSEAGKIIAFASYFTIIANAMMAVSRIFVMFSKGLASSRRILEVIDTPYDEHFGNEEPNQPCDSVISFQDVSFSYLGYQYNVENISFEVKKGQTLGIIGPTGSGKSTIIQLLLRLYQPQKGTINVYNHDIQTYNEKYNTLFGLSLQHDFVFQGTLGDNIRFGRDFSDESVLNALENAQAHEFVSRLPKGLNAPIASKGTNVSGGQRQRILISRAIVSSPDILILDDSSSALDYQTDANLRHALKQSYEGVTKVIVAQRIASILNADIIVVMEDGKMLDSGTHDELLGRCDLYNAIYDTQMGGMIDD